MWWKYEVVRINRCFLVATILRAWCVRIFLTVDSRILLQSRDCDNEISRAIRWQDTDSIRPENFGSARGCDPINSIRFYMISCQNPCTESCKLIFAIFSFSDFVISSIYLPKHKDNFALCYTHVKVQTARCVYSLFLHEQCEDNKSRRCIGYPIIQST